MCHFWVTFRKKVVKMPEDTCNNYVHCVGQIFVDNIDWWTRDIEYHVFRHHMLTLKRKEE